MEAAEIAPRNVPDESRILTTAYLVHATCPLAWNPLRRAGV